VRDDVRVQHASPHRAIRAALFAVVCVGVAAVLHGMADGCQPSWPELGLGVPAVWLAAWPALGRERSGWELTAGLGAMQVGLHYLFTYVGSTAVAPRTPTVPMSAMPDMPISMPSMPGMTAPTLTHPSGIAMFAAHVLAVVICGWWLRQGERDFFALCRVAAALAAAPLHRLTDAIAALRALARVATRDDVPRSPCALPNDGLRHRRTPLLTSVTFRGPPVLA
jgi:hypothetical protein